MSKFLISCKESRIETNRSFYSSFIIGPFHPSESITIATALRRSLLSELPGIGIISVQIEGAAHEYSNLPGIRDSVLDILLNLREVVLKKLSKNMRPQVGYLRARGPGTIVAGDLCLPPFIQCVDPNQHIATLAEDGVLNMKFIIAEGNNYIKGKPKMVIDINQFKKRRLILKKLDQVSHKVAPLSEFSEKGDISYLDNYYCYLKKKLKRKSDKAKNISFMPGSDNKDLSRAKVFLKLKPSYNKNISNSYKVNNTFTQLPTNIKEVNNLKIGKAENFNNKKLNRAIKKNSLTLNLLNVDAVFNPIINVNYIIEINEHKLLENLFDKTTKMSQSLAMIRTKPLLGNSSYDLSPWESLFIKPNIKFNKLISSKILKKKVSSEKDNLETKLTKSKPFLILNSLNSGEPNALFSLKKLLEYQINLEKFQYLTSKTRTLSYNTTNSYSSTGTNMRVKLIEDDQNLVNQKILKNLKKKQENIFEQFHTNTELVSDNILNVQEKDIKIWSSELKKDNVFHNNIILEVWTNGSIHPREAIYEALTYLIRLFSKLKTIKSIEPLIKYEASNIDFVTEFKNNSNYLFPLNQNSFLGKYATFASDSNFNNKQTVKVKKNKQRINNKTANIPISRMQTILGQDGKLNSKIVKEILNATDISVLKIGLRPLMALKNKKINTIAQLINSTKKELLSIPYVDANSVLEIEKSLLKIGLNLKNSTPPGGDTLAI